MKALLGLIVLVAVIVAIVKGCSGSGGDSSSSSVDQMARDFAAYDACKSAVDDQLKAPSTADFQGRTSVDYEDNGGTSIMVSGYVDAENSFGAKLRNDWTCTVDVNSSGEASSAVASVTGG